MCFADNTDVSLRSFSLPPHPSPPPFRPRKPLLAPLPPELQSPSPPPPKPTVDKVPLTAAGSPLAGFARFLHLLSNHPWKDRPLIVDPSSQLTPKQHKHIQTTFDAAKADGGGVRGFTVCTPSDMGGSAWAQEGGEPCYAAEACQTGRQELGQSQGQPLLLLPYIYLWRYMHHIEWLLMQGVCSWAWHMGTHVYQSSNLTYIVRKLVPYTQLKP